MLGHATAPARQHVRLGEIRTIVAEGGGVKGVAGVGALKRLKEAGVIENLERVAGTSAGAIMVTLLAVGYSVEELEEILMTLDFKTFLSESWGYARDVWRLFTKFGWYDGEAFGEWIADKIEAKTGSRDISFAELAERREAGEPFLELYLNAYSLSEQCLVRFSHDNDDFKHTPLAQACRASMSIPFFFTAPKIKDVDGQVHTMIDGGIMANFDIEAFDETKVVIARDGTKFDVKVPNMSVLGIRLDPTEEIQRITEGKRKKFSIIDGLIKFIKAVMRCLMGQENHHFKQGPANVARTIFANTLDYGTTQFNLSQADKDNLLQSGYECADRYCKGAACETACEQECDDICATIEEPEVTNPHHYRHCRSNYTSSTSQTIAADFPETSANDKESKRSRRKKRA